MKKTFLLIILLFLGAVSASAQLYRYLDTNQGLSSRRVVAIEKDTKGYMWFLTHEGIDRYNGKQFTHYTLADGNRQIQQLPNLSQLQIDKQGGIWVIGKNGYVFKYNSYQDKYDLVMNFADSLQTTRRLPLTYTGIDRDDHLWLCTRNAQYIYHTSDQQIEKLKSPIQEEITFVEQGNGNQYFIGTHQNIHLAKLEGEQLIVKETPALKDFHIVQHLYYHSPTNQLLIGTMADGFYLYDISAQTLKNIGGLKDVTMNKVVPVHASDEEVWIATDGNGVYQLNMVNLEMKSFNQTNGDIIKDILVDEENRLWLAVFPISVTIYSENYPTYEWIQHTNGDAQSSNSQITGVLEDSDGDFWMTTSNGIAYYNPQTKQWRNLLTSQQNIREKRNHVFISLCETTPGTILVGGYTSGIYRIQKKDMSTHYFSLQKGEDSDIRPDKYIRSIYRDKDGQIWAGGYYHFKRIDPYTQQLEYYSTDYPITFITEKNSYELWIGTVNGIYKFNKKQKKLQQVYLSSDIGTVNSIYQADSIRTYIGTHGTGLWVFNNQTKQLENYHTQNSSLISNNIFCILPGHQPEELILTTDNELVCFNTSKGSFQNWTKEQGLPTSKFNTSAGIKTRKGDIVLGSDEGLLIIKDSISLPQNIQSKLVFTNFNIQYQQMKPGMEDSPLSKPIDETEEITLQYDQNIFSLDVSSINYDCPSHILYSWKLEGFYEEWTKPSESHLIRYTGLAPGNYTLKVRSTLLDDGQTLEERHLRIIIEPPFTQTIGAYLIYTFILLLFVVAGVRYVWLRKESHISKEKIRFFTHTAHDIRTPLTLIKGPLNEISRTEKLSEEGNYNLQTAIQNANHLSEWATKLIEFQKEELYTSQPHVCQIELNQYLEYFLAPFQSYAEKKHIHLIYERTSQELNAWIDRNKIDSIIHNLTSNAFKYTPEGGTITIQLQRTATEWTLTISDTGIGISQSDQKKIFTQLFRGENAVNQQITGTGIGMLQTHRLVKRHMGKISVSSKENEGTTFRLRFPIDSKKYIKDNRIPTTSTEQLSIDNIDTSLKTKTTSPAHAPQLLIVEDNPDLRRFLRQSLSSTYQIEEVANGKDALELISQKQPDLILSDIMMPVMRGDEMCQILKSNMETSHIPVILLTALGDRESILHGLEIKADSYVIKPFDMEILKANIASVLANKEFLRQRFAQLNYQTEDLPKEVQEAPGLSLDQEFLMKATDMVKKNLGKDFNVDDLCLEMGMSRSSLYNKIKALTDHSPSEFVRQIRMTEAATLLRSKKYTVAEVSDMLGYSDPKYFTDIFKKHYGTTPSAYMKQPLT